MTFTVSNIIIEEAKREERAATEREIIEWLRESAKEYVKHVAPINPEQARLLGIIHWGLLEAIERREYRKVIGHR